MATIKDIAKMAGVSTATVSRIINGKGEAKKETIERVMKLVDELDYQPNRLAKSLSQGKSDLIGIMVPNLKNPFFGELVTCIEETATKYGLNFFSAFSTWDKSLYITILSSDYLPRIIA